MRVGLTHVLFLLAVFDGVFCDVADAHTIASQSKSLTPVDDRTGDSLRPLLLSSQPSASSQSSQPSTSSQSSQPSTSSQSSQSTASQSPQVYQVAGNGTACAGQCASKVAVTHGLAAPLLVVVGMLLMAVLTFAASWKVVGFRKYFRLVLSSVGIEDYPLTLPGEEANTISDITAPPAGGSDLVKFFSNPPNELKINAVALIILLCVFLIRFVLEFNGIDVTMANIAITHLLAGGLSFLADLLVTGRMKISDLRDVNFLKQHIQMLLMFVLTVFANMTVVTAISLIIVDNLYAPAQAQLALSSLTPTTFFVSLFTQILFLTILREHWTYKNKFLSRKRLPTGKTWIVVVSSLVAVAFFGTVVMEYQRSLMIKMCDNFWTQQVGVLVCDMYASKTYQLPITLCVTYCHSGKFYDEPVCKQLDWAALNCHTTLQQNVGFDVAALAIGSFAVFLIGNNTPFSFSAWGRKSSLDDDAEAEIGKAKAAPAGEVSTPKRESAQSDEMTIERAREMLRPPALAGPAAVLQKAKKE